MPSAKTPPKPGHADNRAHHDGRMGPLEAQYAAHLDTLVAAGLIARWEFQPDKLRVVEPVAAPKRIDPADEFEPAFATGRPAAIREGTYTPDFKVWGLKGGYCYHETKGWLDKGGDGWLKFKLAASQHPVPFFMVERKAKQWVIKRHAR